MSRRKQTRPRALASWYTRRSVTRESQWVRHPTPFWKQTAARVASLPHRDPAPAPRPFVPTSGVPIPDPPGFIDTDWPAAPLHSAAQGAADQWGALFGFGSAWYGRRRRPVSR